MSRPRSASHLRALQFPIGSLADRFGMRIVLTVSIIAWSLCTADGFGVGRMPSDRATLPGACESGISVCGWTHPPLASTEGVAGRAELSRSVVESAVPSLLLTVFAAITLLGIPSLDDPSRSRELAACLCSMGPSALPRPWCSGFCPRQSASARLG